MSEDPRLAAARYRVDRLSRDETPAPEDGGAPDAPSGDTAEAQAAGAREPNALDRAAYVEVVIEQAIRRGEFDDLPGAGKPIPDLGRQHDPDWWIRRKIETERLTGLGPPALTLRVEERELSGKLDELAREDDVREAVEDFNRRVIEARRQLLGGPPVVTPTRDVEAEVSAWRARRATRVALLHAEAADAAARRGSGIRSLFRRRRR
ncbi:DUF1992 domain-containing protein [Microbacterium sp. HD4P20]|uniref:DnaJ family domain-containing protein n=1 Tax=Microbacterium sp. HD4P20 TaxID=2864874 RepID=UPI001C63F60D|nr:DUF1992 domain-containing protein [Microbacterium sp. HD4P20]MCP2636116.1 DUF1992 domain-containing protein [Microbacterium sp. HD4P20]